MALPDAVLASNLISYWNQGYTYATGDYLDDKGNATSFSQATPGDRPTWDLSQTLSSRGVLVFTGATNLRLDGGALSSGAVPAYSGGNVWIQFCAFKRSTTVDNVEERIIDYDGYDALQLLSNQIYWLGTYSNTTLTNTNWTRVITVTTQVDGTTTQYVNGAGQSSTSNSGFGSGIRTNWLSQKFLGNRNNLSTPFFGYIGCFGFAVASSWSGSDTTALDASIDEWLTTGVAGSPQYVNNAGSIVSAEAFGRGNVIGGARGPKDPYFRRFPVSVGWRNRATMLGGPPTPAQVLFEKEFWGNNVASSGIPSAQAFGSATITLGGGGSGQNLSPSGVASAQAFGTAKLNLKAVAQAIASLEAFGTSRLGLKALPSAISTAEAVGTPKLNLRTTAPSITSAESFGTARLRLFLLTSAIGSSEVFGTTSVLRGTVTVTASGIASAQAFGTAVVQRGAVLVTPSGIASGQAFGTTTVQRGLVTVSPSSIASGEAVGSALVGTGGTVIAPGGISTAVAFGTHTVSRGVVFVSPSGIVSAQAFGTAKLTLTVVPSGVATANAFGTTSVLRGAVTMSPSGISSATAFGSAFVSVGSSFLLPSSIATAEAFGTSKLNLRVVSIGITSGEALGTSKLSRNAFGAGAIASTEAFGTLKVNRNVKPTGLLSSELVPGPILSPGGVSVQPTGIASVQAFGSTIITSGGTLIVGAGNIASATVVPSPVVLRGVVTLHPASVLSAEAVSNPRVGYQLRASGILTSEAFGTSSLRRHLHPTGISSAQAFGTLTVARGGVVVSPAGIATGQAFGTANIGVGVYFMAPSSISSLEAFGSPIVPRGGVSVAPSSILSGQQFGSSALHLLLRNAGNIASGAIVPGPRLGLALLPTGIVSSEIVAAQHVIPGFVLVSPGSIASAQAFGTSTLSRIYRVSPSGIASQQTFGAPKLTLYLKGVGNIVSGEAVSTPRVLKFIQDIIGAGAIPSEEAFGRPLVFLRLVPVVVKPVPGPTGIARANSHVLTRGPSIRVSPAQPPSQGGTEDKNKGPSLPIVISRPTKGPKGTKR